MKYLGVISDPKDLTNKKYVDDKVGEVSASLTTLSGRVDTAEDNIQMAESDIGDLQTETGTLKTDMTAVKTAVKTLQDTYVPNTTKVNGKALDTDVTLTATDVGALPSTTTYVSTVDGASGAVTTNAVKYTTQTLTNTQKAQVRTNIGAGTSSFSGAYSDLTGKPTIPSKTSQLTNDSDYITASGAPVQSVDGATGTVTTNAVKYTTQLLSTAQKTQARANIGAGTSSFSGSYTDLTDKPTIPTMPTSVDGMAGGELTSDLTVGSAKIQTNGYVTGTWFKATADVTSASKQSKVCVLSDDGWIYTRTNAQLASDIGAGNANLYKINSVSVATSAWVANTNSQASAEEKQDYPFMATVSITTPAVTSADIARVMFGYAEQASGSYSLNCYTTTNGVIIQATEKPSAAITLEYILIERIL